MVAIRVTSVGSFTLSGLVTCGSFWMAARHRVKVWIFVATDLGVIPRYEQVIERLKGR